MIGLLLIALMADSMYFANPMVTGNLQRGMEEASGIVASKQHPGLFWVHNDSGDGPVIYGIDSMGRRRCAYEFMFDDVIREGMDWEDIAYGWHVGINDTTYYIYVADIGDNNARRDFVNIYQMREGSNIKFVPDGKTEAPRSFSASRRSFVYPDGARDAETLLFDPMTNDLYVVSKRDKRCRLYRVPTAQPEHPIDTLIFVTELPMQWATGGDISTDGREILIKNYTHVYHWIREAGEPLASAFTRKPTQITYRPEPQGEAICFNVSGAGYYTVSEAGHNGNTAPINYYARTTTAPEQNLIVKRTKKRQLEYTVQYTLPNTMPVGITVHNELMMTVRIIADGKEKAGAHTHKIDMSTAAPGTYVVVFQSGTTYNAVPLTIEDPSVKGAAKAREKAPVATSKRKRKK